MSLPRALDALRFAEDRRDEISVLHEQIRSSVDTDRYGIHGLPRHLRRRARSYHRYNKFSRRRNVKKTNTDEVGGEDGRAEREEVRFENRRMRRRKMFQRIPCPWLDESVDETMLGNTEKVHRLQMHVWHAKRMAMVKFEKWHWYLPLGKPGKGKGTRSFQHTLKTGSVFHDASYWCPVELVGETSDVMALLRCLSPGAHKKLQDSMERWVDSNNQNNVEVNSVAVKVSEGVPVVLGPVFVTLLPEGGKKGHVRAVIWAHCGYAHLLREEINHQVDPASARVTCRAASLSRIEIRGKKCMDVLVRMGKRMDDTNQWNLLKSKLEGMDPGEVSQVCVRSSGAEEVSHRLDEQIDRFAKALLLQFSKGSMERETPNGLELWVIRQQEGISMVVTRYGYPSLFKLVAFCGAHVTGQREWHWYHTLNASAFYPFDFPDIIDYSISIAQYQQKKRDSNLLAENTRNIMILREEDGLNHLAGMDVDDSHIATKAKPQLVVSPSLSNKAMIEVLVWATGRCVFGAGDKICHSDKLSSISPPSEECFGFISSPRLYHGSIHQPSFGFVEKKEFYRILRKQGSDGKDRQMDHALAKR